MKNKKLITLAVLVLTVIFLIVLFVYKANAITIDQNKLYPVVYVVDGDTLKVKINSHIVTVRMLGINTPETVDPRKKPECFGKQASDEAKSLLERREVRLALNPNREEKDKYGRYLAYVYRDDGLFINEYMLQNGFAKEYTYGSPYSMRGEFKIIEKSAIEANKGLWNACLSGD